MVNTFVWPWKNDAELLEVRDLFYPSAQVDDGDRLEKQQLAVNIVNTWKLRRSRIPHSILATADLMDAILHHDACKNSASTIKAVYASALAKMVTSVCDLEQDSVEKRSMMEQAKKIGMPEDWVHLRHAITHGETPGLVSLQVAVQDAVPWMWEHFWKHLTPESEISEEERRSQLIEILTGFRRQRRSAITATSDVNADSNLTAQTSKTIKRLSKNSDSLDILVDTLIHENIILPSEKQTNLKFKALVLVWDDLLLSVAKRLSAFYPKIVSGLVQYLISQTPNTAKPVAALEMASKWLRHVLLNEVWASLTSAPSLENLRCEVVETCLLRKTDLTDLLAREVLTAMSGAHAEAFRQLLELYNDGEQAQESMDVDMASEEGLHDTQIPRTGWSRPVAVWIPRAIGA